MEINKQLMKRNKFFQLWLIIGLVMGLAAVLFFSITYLNNNVLCDVDCRVQNEVTIALILMSLFAMFVGSMTYYFISEKYEKQIIKIQKDVTSTLKFLNREEQMIVKSILNHKGKTTQSEITRDTGLSRVKIFRSLKKLEERKIITKRPNGMTNFIELEENLKKVLVE